MRLDETGGGMGRWVAVLVPASQLAERIAGTEFVPAAMRGKPDVVTAAIMYGDEIGVGPMQALAGIHVVDGRPQPSAELMRALIQRAGHHITVHTLTGEVCRLSGLRAGHPESNRVAVSWTLDMARAAGLLNKQNWQRYPRAMLLARATGDLARILFADTIKGLGTLAEDNPDELSAWADQIPDDTPPPVAPPRAVTRRRDGAKRLPEPGHHIATPDAPGPDGSVDVPLPESVPHGPPEPEAALVPGGGGVGAGNATTAPPSSSAGRGVPESGNTGVRAPRGTNEPDPLPPTSATAPDTGGGADPGPPHLGLMGDRQRRAVFAAFDRIGITGSDADRPRRLALAAVMLGKPVETFANVTRQDGFTLTRLATDIETGVLAWDESAGELRRLVDDEPPDDKPGRDGA
jgi:hypothetical protein